VSRALTGPAARRAAVAAAVGLVAIGFAGGVIGRAVTGPLAGPIVRDLDTPVRQFALGHDTAAWHRLFSHVSGFGTGIVTGALAVAVGALAARRWRTPVVLVQCVTAFAGAAVLTVVVKFGVHRAPASGPIARFAAGTFPSGHALFAVSVYGTFATLVVRASAPRLLRVLVAGLLVALALAVGWSRVFLLDHFASDVVGSLVLGAAWVAVVAVCAERVH
jgi:hypothetical protein